MINFLIESRSLGSSAQDQVLQSIGLLRGRDDGLQDSGEDLQRDFLAGFGGPVIRDLLEVSMARSG